MFKLTDISDKPIGIFDSGIGGLTVCKEIVREMPNENIVYFGDTARVPYGSKSIKTIRKYSFENAQVLMNFQVKMIVVACNTTCAVSIPLLKENFEIPIVDVIEPTVELAVKITRNKRIGVIGTRQTIASNVYYNAIKQINSHIKVASCACPLFVPLVEEGWLQEEATYLIVRKYLNTLTKQGIDTLILGCTHYPFLKKVIQKILGIQVKLISSGNPTAKRAKEILKKREALRNTLKPPYHKFFVSDDPGGFQKLVKNFWRQNIPITKLAEIEEKALSNFKTLPVSLFSCPSGTKII